MAEIARTYPVTIVGLHGGASFGPGAAAALAGADVIIGASRHLNEMAPSRAACVALAGPIDEAVLRAGDLADRGQRVVVVASGDPGFFGVARIAAELLAPRALVIYPAPSAVSLAFGRLGQSWDDARVVSAHGRSLEEAVRCVLMPGPGSHKVAVLTSPTSPPEALARVLGEHNASERPVAVCSQLGSSNESVTITDLRGLAHGAWDPVSVVVLGEPSRSDVSDGQSVPSPHSGAPQLSFGAPDDSYAHRAGMITKAEVRAVVLGKLSIPSSGVVWDVGAGSGAVAIEAARLSPGLDVYAIERNGADVERIRNNATGVRVKVIEGSAPEIFAELPDPDRIFVGGGGSEVLDSALLRLRPGGVAVASFASVERAIYAARRLGQMIQLSVSRAVPIGPDESLRLEAENPVFVCWGQP